MSRRTGVAAFALSACFFVASGGQAAEPDVKCESGKLKVSSKFAACRLKADAKAVSKGGSADYTKCTDKFSSKWESLEAKAGVGVCPSEGDEASIESRITGETAEIATLLSGVRYEDTGLGTVIDHQTGLEWQKTDDAGGLTDKDNTYSWSVETALEDPDGTAFTEFLFGLNDCESADGVTVTGGHGGHCDWRLPTVVELAALLLEPEICGTSPCIDESVFGPTSPFFYWSSTLDLFDPQFVWEVDFHDGFIDATGKQRNDRHVRAVRGAD